MSNNLQFDLYKQFFVKIQKFTYLFFCRYLGPNQSYPRDDFWSCLEFSTQANDKDCLRAMTKYNCRINPKCVGCSNPQKNPCPYRYELKTILNCDCLKMDRYDQVGTQLNIQSHFIFSCIGSSDQLTYARARKSCCFVLGVGFYALVALGWCG